MKDANFHGVVVVIVVVVVKFLLLLSRSTDWCLNTRHDTRSRFTLIVHFVPFFCIVMCYASRTEITRGVRGNKRRVDVNG